MDNTLERHCEILSAWIDGERTDPAEVRQALETPEGRAFVVDAMSVRRVVALTATAVTRHDAVGVTRRATWLAAAAAAVMCIGLGYGVAHMTSPEGAPRAQVDNGRVIPVSAPTAPQPTHVIRFESGVDWRETSGGN